MEAWNAISARQALEAACVTLSLRPERLQLLQFGKSAVYRLSEDLVARVSRPGTDLGNIEAGIRLAAWLNRRGFPLAPPSEILEPVRIGEASVSFWLWRGPSRPVSAVDMAELLLRFHQETADYPHRLPNLDPTHEIGRRIRRLEEHDLLLDPDAEILWSWQRHLEKRLRMAPSDLGRGPIHGNAQQTNAWAAPDGPLLFDFDQVAYGPREWDLVAEAVAPRRFARDRAFYEELLARYGYPVTRWAGFTDAVLAHELLLTLARISIDAHLLGGASTEAERRMAYWRGDPRPPVWKGY